MGAHTAVVIRTSWMCTHLSPKWTWAAVRLPRIRTFPPMPQIQHLPCPHPGLPFLPSLQSDCPLWSQTWTLSQKEQCTPTKAPTASQDRRVPHPICQSHSAVLEHSSQVTPRTSLRMAYCVRPLTRLLLGRRDRQGCNLELFSMGLILQLRRPGRSEKRSLAGMLRSEVGLTKRHHL